MAAASAAAAVLALTACIQTHYRMPCTTRWQRRNDDESGKPVSTKNFAQHKRLFHSVVLLTTEKCCHYRMADAIDERTLKIIPRFHSILADAGTRTIRLSLHQQRKRKKILWNICRWNDGVVIFFFVRWRFFFFRYRSLWIPLLSPFTTFNFCWRVSASQKRPKFRVLSGQENGVIMIASGEALDWNLFVNNAIKQTIKWACDL